MDFSDLWKKTLPFLRNAVGSSNFELWMKYINPFEIRENIFIFTVPNKILQGIIKDRFKPIIEETLSFVAKTDIEVDFSVDGENIRENIIEEEPVIKISNLNSKYTFENFVVGGGNTLAVSAALSVCEKPGEVYNPFFIYGGVGLGKTHLMQAIGNSALKKNPKIKVLYVSSEEFTNELVNSIREGETDNFRKKYREIDILLIDDIQFIAGKSKTEEEFFHTFNTLHQANKQIVLTSDKPPKDIGYMEKRLISRFASGLTADIQPPDFETRVAILQKKRHAENLPVSDDILEYIAKNITSNVRQLKAAMVQINANQAFLSRRLDLDEAKEILKNSVEKREKIITPEEIKKFICKTYSISLEDLESKKRVKSIAEPRQLAMYLTRELTEISLIKIGESFSRDHSTVVHAIEKIEKIIKKDPDFERIVKKYKESIMDECE